MTITKKILQYPIAVNSVCTKRNVYNSEVSSWTGLNLSLFPRVQQKTVEHLLPNVREKRRRGGFGWNK